MEAYERLMGDLEVSAPLKAGGYEPPFHATVLAGGYEPPSHATVTSLSTYKFSET